MPYINIKPYKYNNTIQCYYVYQVDEHYSHGRRTKSTTRRLHTAYTLEGAQQLADQERQRLEQEKLGGQLELFPTTTT